MTSLPEPSASTVDPVTALLDYLDYFRAEIRRKVIGLDKRDLCTSRLPSGWTPLELIAHLVHMERRWLVWGLLGEAVTAPWGDQNDDGFWHTDLDVTILLDLLDDGGRRTSAIVRSHPAGGHAASGGRFPEGEAAPTLLAILLHVEQEYARHTGHLDIVREMCDGLTGEGSLR